MYSLSDDEQDAQHGSGSDNHPVRGQGSSTAGARMRSHATPSPPLARALARNTTAPSAVNGISRFIQQEAKMVSLDEEDDQYDPHESRATAGSSRTQSRSPSLLPAHPTGPQRSRTGMRQGGGGARPGGPTSPTLSSFTDSVGTNAFAPAPAIDRLQRLWVAQRACPEMLAWSSSTSGGNSIREEERWRCDETVDEVCAQIEEQTSILNLLSSDEGTSEEEHLRLSMVQLDVERSKWLLRAFLRTRLHKLETFSMHYSSLSTLRRSHILSPLEQAYLSKYTSIRSTHFSSSVLDYLPEALRSLTDGEEEENGLSTASQDFDSEDDRRQGSAGAGVGKGGMVPRPDLSGPVFVRCTEDCGEVRTEEGENANLSKGSIHLLTYGSVRALVRQGRVELL